MRKLASYKYVFTFIICFLFVYIYIMRYKDSKESYTNIKLNYYQDGNTIERIVISVVVCDLRYNESLNVVKSALLFTKTPIYFVIFADDILRPKLNKTLSLWRTLTRNQWNFELQRINFPADHTVDWMNLFRKCAAQRLFFPKLLPHIDAMIYVDTDTLFLGPADELWQYFSKFNSSQFSALALEDHNPNVSWYSRFAKHPFYGKYGLNSGVMLMNLTRMRNFGWVDYVTPIMLKWKLYIPWGDQDIINILFHYHSRAVLELPCRHNFRSDQCVYGDACPAAAARGALVLHGSRFVFHNEKQPAFQAIYRAIDEYEVGNDPSLSLVNKMQRYFEEALPSNCGNLKEAFLRVPIQTINELYSAPKRALDEVHNNIMSLKTNGVTGQDNVPTGFLTLAKSETVPIITHLKE